MSIGTGANDSVTIRFVVSYNLVKFLYFLTLSRLIFQTDNPGPWFIHCHIDFHLNAGLAAVMAEDIPDIKLANPVPGKYSCHLLNEELYSMPYFS